MVNKYKEERTMANKKNWLGILVMVLVFGVMVVGCGGASSLAGRCVTEDGGKAPSSLPDNLELFKNGTGVCEGMSISWKVEKGRFILTSSLFGFTYDYKLSGKKLILTDDEGESETYVKKE
jgi:hypothetical protein